MDMLVTIIMLVLFIFLMVFIFSTALLTPMIGKRNLIFVLSLGFIVGLVGGAFFIAPLYDDMPDMARSVFTFSTQNPEVININISTDNDINAFIADTKKFNGVKDVQSNKITIKTTQFNITDWKEPLEGRIPVLESDVKSVEVNNNDSFSLILNNNSNPTQLVKNVDEWLKLVGGMEIISNIAEISIYVEPSQVDSVSAQLPQDKVVITNVTGPVEDQITSFKKNLPDRTSIVIICGLIGLFVGAIGLFIDSISQLWDRIRLRLALRRKKLK
jgi:hypothetical protein